MQIDPTKAQSVLDTYNAYVKHVRDGEVDFNMLAKYTLAVQGLLCDPFSIESSVLAGAFKVFTNLHDAMVKVEAEAQPQAA